ncbi:hypothetical protein CBM2637_B100045 [Cupriavidus taiwanensis]|nr:hypothetical protein CBM2637_B100045 [Cupriavidus taiwanensis]SPA55923.1 protein of unknown function [Cupriavidus taiwanensis]
MMLPELSLIPLAHQSRAFRDGYGTR